VYRAYSVAALKDIPFEQNSDDFDFDTEIIIQLHEAGKRIHEIPIPTYYGDEICRVNGMAYALDVTRAALRYRAHKMGFGSGELAFSNDAYEAKTDIDSSHAQLIEWLSGYPARRILDLGCNDGSLAAELRVHGHEVVGVDVAEHPGVRDRTDQFLQADLEQGIPTEAGTGFDVVLAADVLEHVSDPQRMLEQARSRLTPGGSVVTSVRPLVPQVPRAARSVRLRPSGHPRQGPPSVLHAPQLRAARSPCRVPGAATRGTRAAVRRDGPGR
jgi:SAM-dependent methyltransferase